MPLISLWRSNPETVLTLNIEQIVSNAGDGRLKDNSECSNELRAFLTQVPSNKLGEYADHCLTSSFNKSGQILQDVVNEMGRRLDYIVENGRYQGTTNHVGNDGLWKSPEGHDLLVEVKTTDAYRISLDTIATYRNKQLKAENTDISSKNSILIVVGRNDTGDLEAQVRGSRHAWDMRLISVDSLLRLVRLKENTEETETSKKIRSILIPFEYTRVDSLIDVIFTTANDSEILLENTEIDDSLHQNTLNEEDKVEKSGWVFTDANLMQAKRDKIVTSFANKLNKSFIQKSKAQYWDGNHQARVVCAVSKRYTKNQTIPYWYAFHTHYVDFLGEGNEGYLILGCMDMEVAFGIPVDVIKNRLNELNTTTRNDGKLYWHLKIVEQRPSEYQLQMPVSGNHLDLKDYIFNV